MFTPRAIANPLVMLYHGSVLGVLLLRIVARASGDDGEKSVVVSTGNGQIEGLVMTARNGFEAHVFRGIPYAEPPIGERRFSKPVYPRQWLGVWNAKDWPRKCTQCWPFVDMETLFLDNSTHSEGEDCLYLNVFAPSQPAKDERGYPVLLFIHGGGYFSGSTIEYGMRGILDWWLPKGVIGVTIHHRLGIWGFFSMGDASAPGNWGLWDATAALHWVRMNIAAFGGDPARLTVTGVSAGGGMADFLALSPRSQDLYENAILMAGNSFAEWASEPVESIAADSIELAESVGCGGSSEEIVKCMRAVPNDDLRGAVSKTVRHPVHYPRAAQALRDHYNMDVPTYQCGRAFRTHPLSQGCWQAQQVNSLIFGPATGDGDFFPEPIDELRAKATPKPTIIGSADVEGALFTAPRVSFGFPWETTDNYSLADFKSDIGRLYPGNSAPQRLFRKIALHHYLYANSPSPNISNRRLIRQISEAFSDSFMRRSVYEAVESRLKHNFPVYLYSFDYFNPAYFQENHPVKAATHGSDVVYLLNFTAFVSFEHNEVDFRVFDMMTTWFTNFAKYGSVSITTDFKNGGNELYSNPTPQAEFGVRWEPSQKGDNEICLSYLKIDDNPSMEDCYKPSAVSLLTYIRRNVIGAWEAGKTDSRHVNKVEL